MTSLESIGGIAAFSAPVAALGPASTAGPAQAVHDFETLFLETLLQHSGIAETLGGEDAPEGGVAGELMVRTIAGSLADQLKLDLGRYLGVAQEVVP
jgi:hypothetical protein